MTNPAPVKGKGRGKVLEELSGLYGTVMAGLGQGQQWSPRQRASESHAGKAAITFHVVVMLHHHASLIYFSQHFAVLQIR